MAATKNPRLREAGRELKEQIAMMALEAITSTPERFAAHVHRAQADGFIDPDVKVDHAEIREMIERDAFAMTVPTTEHLQVEMASFDEVLPYIFERGWVLFRAQPGRSGFITSDHPSCLDWSVQPPTGALSPGFALTGTQLLFPISNELAAMGSFEFHEEERDADEGLVAEINRKIIRHATRQVYARGDDFPYIVPPETEIRRGSQLLDHLFRAQRPDDRTP